MAEETKKYIKKIKLSDNNIYYVCDSEAAKASALENYLPLTGGTITDSLTIQNICKTNSLYRLQTTELPYEDKPTNVLTQKDDGEIVQRNIDFLLEDVGGISCSVMSDGILSLQIGKQKTS